MHMLHICEGTHWSHCQQTGKCAMANVFSQAAASFQVICTLKSHETPRTCSSLYAYKNWQHKVRQNDFIMAIHSNFWLHPASYLGVGKSIRRSPFTALVPGEPSDKKAQPSSFLFRISLNWHSKAIPFCHTWGLYPSLSLSACHITWMLAHPFLFMYCDPLGE